MSEQIYLYVDDSRTWWVLRHESSEADKAAGPVVVLTSVTVTDLQFSLLLFEHPIILLSSQAEAAMRAPFGKTVQDIIQATSDLRQQCAADESVLSFRKYDPEKHQVPLNNSTSFSTAQGLMLQQQYGQQQMAQTPQMQPPPGMAGGGFMPQMYPNAGMQMMGYHPQMPGMGALSGATVPPGAGRPQATHETEAHVFKTAAELNLPEGITLSDEELKSFMGRHSRLFVAPLRGSRITLWLREHQLKEGQRSRVRYNHATSTLSVVLNLDLETIEKDRPVAIFNRQLCAGFLQRNFCGLVMCVHAHHTAEQVKTMIAYKEKELEGITAEEQQRMTEQIINAEKDALASGDRGKEIAPDEQVMKHYAALGYQFVPPGVGGGKPTAVRARGVAKPRVGGADAAGEQGGGAIPRRGAPSRMQKGEIGVETDSSSSRSDSKSSSSFSGSGSEFGERERVVASLSRSSSFYPSSSGSSSSSSSSSFSGSSASRSRSRSGSSSSSRSRSVSSKRKSRSYSGSNGRRSEPRRQRSRRGKSRDSKSPRDSSRRVEPRVVREGRRRSTSDGRRSLPREIPSPRIRPFESPAAIAPRDARPVPRDMLPPPAVGKPGPLPYRKRGRDHSTSRSPSFSRSPPSRYRRRSRDREYRWSPRDRSLTRRENDFDYCPPPPRWRDADRRSRGDDRLRERRWSRSRSPRRQRGDSIDHGRDRRYGTRPPPLGGEPPRRPAPPSPRRGGFRRGGGGGGGGGRGGREGGPMRQGPPQTYGRSKMVKKANIESPPTTQANNVNRL